jgi:hypothetical protein
VEAKNQRQELELTQLKLEAESRCPFFEPPVTSPPPPTVLVYIVD